MNWSEFKNKEEIKKIGKDNNGYLYAAFTDKILLCNWLGIEEEKENQIEKDFEKLLEIRVFDKTSEFRMARTSLGREFNERFIDDTSKNDKYNDYFDENQFLDIDSTKSSFQDNKMKITTTGGGKYELPFECGNDQRIIIRNYIGYYEQSGQAYVKDWRIVGFE